MQGGGEMDGRVRMDRQGISVPKYSVHADSMLSMKRGVPA